MFVKLSDCVRCGRGVGVEGREHCARCHWQLAHQPVRQRCPRCHNQRVLRADTGRCARCSRACVSCGALVGRVDRALCRFCLRRIRRAQLQQRCPRCAKPGYLRQATGWCGPCSHPGRPANPDTACEDCGQVTRLVGAGLCRRCWERSPHRIQVRADNLAARLDEPPDWLAGFADYLTGRHHPTRACQMITVLGRLLDEHAQAHPQRLLEAATERHGPLAGALEDFFTTHRLAMPLDHEERRASARRTRRLDAIPPPLRSAVADFADHQVDQRRRAQRAGTRPRGHLTIESHLTTVRDLAQFLADQRGVTDWATVQVGDIEAFLADQPSTRAHRLGGLRKFFGFAARRRLILADPTRQVTAPQPWGFRGPTLSRDQQRNLFRRWTTNDDVHPHEALVGLLALLHGATTQEIRRLTVDAIDPTERTVGISGRPQPTPVDPWTWTAIENCLAHRAQLASSNPHLLITSQTKATRAPASDGYVKHRLDPVGVGPRILRSTRLAALATTVDPKLVATAYGMTNDAVTSYLADHVDATRIANP